MAFQTVIYYFGYCVALVLYKDMGRIFFLPMLLNLWFNLLITLKIYQQVDFRWLIAVHGMLWLVWVLALGRVTRSRTETVLALLLIVGAFIFGTLPNLTKPPGTYRGMIELSTRIWTIWYFSAFVVVVAVFLRSTVIAKWKKEFVDILTNPRKRFLLPMGVCSGFIGLTPLLQGTVPEALIIERFNIGSHLLAWGWVVVELPFFITYERLKRQR
jgi:hypothetical protein